MDEGFRKQVTRFLLTSCCTIPCNHNASAAAERRDVDPRPVHPFFSRVERGQLAVTVVLFKINRYSIVHHALATYGEWGAGAWWGEAV